MIRSTTSRHAAVLGLGWLIALGAANAARAQHTADPYNPWNSQFEQYVYPSFPNGFGVSPNQVLLQMPTTRSTSRQFQQYLGEENDTFESDARGGSYSSASRRAVGVPYYRAYRQFDRAYKRVYTPNEEVDRGYETARQARDEKYSEYIATTNPKERTKLRKELEQLNRKTQHDLVGADRGPARRASPSASPASPDLPPVTAPPRRRLPSLTVPESTPHRGTPTNRRGPRSSAPARSLSETPRRSELLDRPSSPVAP